MTATKTNWQWRLNEHGEPEALMDGERHVIYLRADVGNYGLSVDSYMDTEPVDLAKIAAADDLLEACKALLEAARGLRGEVVCTGTLTGKTLGPMFEADDLAQAAIAKATYQEPTHA